MKKWLLLVSTDSSVPSREAEFNKWYDQLHLPDVMEIPGFVRAARYEKAKPNTGPGKFLAAYEIESDDIEKTIADI